MKVWIVIHAGIEDDIYPRGVFSTPELADQMVELDEIRDLGDRRSHDRYCCSVSEWQVLDHLKFPEFGPARPSDRLPMEWGSADEPE